MCQLPRPLDFAVVGAAKSGTSSLSALLHQHPSIHIMQPKDGHFFSGVIDKPRWQGPRDEVFNQKISQTQRTFPTQLASLDPMLKVGDASVFYMTDPPALRALRSQISETGIVIAVLRRPDQRAYSAYMHMVREGLEELDFAQALEREGHRRNDRWQPIWWYRELGNYAKQIEQLQEIFGPERVIVLRYEDVVARTREVLEPVLARLGVPWVPLQMHANNQSGVPNSRALQTFLSDRNIAKTIGKRLIPRHLWLRARQSLEHVNLQRTQMSPTIEHELVAGYCEDVTRLEKLVGLDLSEWKSPTER